MRPQHLIKRAGRLANRGMWREALAALKEAGEDPPRNEHTMQIRHHALAQDDTANTDTHPGLVGQVALIEVLVRDWSVRAALNAIRRYWFLRQKVNPDGVFFQAGRGLLQMWDDAVMRLELEAQAKLARMGRKS